MTETDEEKVQRYTECLMNGLDIKRALKRLYDLKVPSEVFKRADTIRFAKRYEQKSEYKKYAERVIEKLRQMDIKIKRELEEDDYHESGSNGIKKPKKEENTDELFAKAMGGGSSSSSSAPRGPVDYSKYKVTKRLAAVEPKKEPVDVEYDCGMLSTSSATSSQELTKKPREYAPTVPCIVKPVQRNHVIPQSASLLVDESQFKPRKGRQKVFAGRRKRIGEEIPSLLCMCQDVLASNVGMIDHVGYAPYHLLKPAFLNATVDQLRRIVDLNPLLAEEIDEIFCDMVRREFPKYADRERSEGDITWRQMYDKLVSRKQKKDDNKLKMLTERIGKGTTGNDKGRKTMTIDMAHTRVKNSFFTNTRDTQVKMLNTPSAIQLSQARKHVKTEGKAQLASITPRGGLGPTRSSRGGPANIAAVKKTAPLMAKCKKMLKR